MHFQQKYVLSSVLCWWNNPEFFKEETNCSNASDILQFIEALALMETLFQKFDEMICNVYVLHYYIISKSAEMILTSWNNRDKKYFTVHCLQSFSWNLISLYWSRTFITYFFSFQLDFSDLQSILIFSEGLWCYIEITSVYM